MRPPSAAVPAVYRRLSAALGPQGWWPLTPPGGSQPLYHPGSFPSLGEGERFEIAVGAILTQNTSWLNVLKALAALRRAGLTTPRRIAAAPPLRLRSLVRPSGYFRQKALKLRRFSEETLRRGGLGRWMRRPTQRLREELLAVWGIGRETADSILLYACGRPVFVVDAYTLRAGRRLGLFRSGDYERVRSYFQRSLPSSVRLYQEFHALWVALAKFYCRAEPLCPGCPLLDLCPTGMRHVHA